MFFSTLQSLPWSWKSRSVSRLENSIYFETSLPNGMNWAYQRSRLIIISSLCFQSKIFKENCQLVNVLGALLLPYHAQEFRGTWWSAENKAVPGTDPVKCWPTDLLCPRMVPASNKCTHECIDLVFRKIITTLKALDVLYEECSGLLS